MTDYYHHQLPGMSGASSPSSASTSIFHSASAIRHYIDSSANSAPSLSQVPFPSKTVQFNFGPGGLANKFFGLISCYVIAALTNATLICNLFLKYFLVTLSPALLSAHFSLQRNGPFEPFGPHSGSASLDQAVQSSNDQHLLWQEIESRSEADQPTDHFGLQRESHHSDHKLPAVCVVSVLQRDL